MASGSGTATASNSQLCGQMDSLPRGVIVREMRVGTADAVNLEVEVRLLAPVIKPFVALAPHPVKLSVQMTA
jgi:hypothetical protein